MSEFVQALKSVRDVYINFPKKLGLNKELLKKIELEIMDFEHLLELTNFNACEGYKYAKEIKRLRIERRNIKDEIEILEQIRDFISFPKPSEKVINKAIGDVRRVENRHESRCYSMRVRTDLQELIKND